MGPGVYLHWCHRGHEDHPRPSGASTQRYAIDAMSLTYPSQLELTLDDIKWAIVAARKLKVKQEVRVHLVP